MFSLPFFIHSCHTSLQQQRKVRWIKLPSTIYKTLDLLQLLPDFSVLLARIPFHSTPFFVFMSLEVFPVPSFSPTCPWETYRIQLSCYIQGAFLLRLCSNGISFLPVFVYVWTTLPIHWIPYHHISQNRDTSASFSSFQRGFWCFVW